MGICGGRTISERPTGPAQPKVRSIFPDAADSSFDAELHRAVRGEDFTFAGTVTLAKVVEVYDGDTVRLVFRYRGALVQYRVRMLGYDSPEMKPPRNQPNREAEVAAARAARAALELIALNKVLVADLGAFDKYGRVLATVYLTNDLEARDGAVCVNEWMVSQGHGVSYAGGTKAPYAQPAE